MLILSPASLPFASVSNTYHAVHDVPLVLAARWKMAHSHRLENRANLFDRATLFPGPVPRQSVAVCERGRGNIKVEFKPSWWELGLDTGTGAAGDRQHRCAICAIEAIPMLESEGQNITR